MTTATGEKGYNGKMLSVNLSTGEITTEQIADETYRKYLGGYGIGARFALDRIPKGADPLGPDNMLGFFPGLLTGTPLFGQRFQVVAKSPLTGGWGDANCGGDFGPILKHAGWDGVMVTGQATTPKMLMIDNDQVQLVDAGEYWGMDAIDCEDALQAKYGKKATGKQCSVALIGPSGENLSLISGVCNERGRLAARSGVGAVMGSKKLKAIAVRGKTAVKIADQPALTGIAKWVSGTLEQNHRAFHEFGTGGAMQGKSLEGGMPTLNYRLGSFEHVAEVDAVAVRDQVRVRMTACYACSVRCKKVVHIEQREEDAKLAEETTYKGKTHVAHDPKGRWRVDPKYGGPEYESLASLGVNLGLDDLIAICKSNEICNYLGMDTVSAGATLAWAMECYEKEIITAADTGGIPIRFHDAEGVVAWLERIANREGFGDLLAEGSLRASKIIGKGSEQLLTTVKGMEMAMHDPRHMPPMRASYLLAPTGGDHMRQTGNKNGVRNQVGMCHFLAYDDDQSLDILNAVTGWGATAEELITTAHRGLTLARLFNLREGFTRADDALPPRFSEDLPKHQGLTKAELDQIVTDYYIEQGWDPETGVPLPETLRELEIEEDATVAV